MISMVLVQKSLNLAVDIFGSESRFNLTVGVGAIDLLVLFHLLISCAALNISGVFLQLLLLRPLLLMNLERSADFGFGSLVGSLELLSNIGWVIFVYFECLCLINLSKRGDWGKWEILFATSFFWHTPSIRKDPVFSLSSFITLNDLFLRLLGKHPFRLILVLCDWCEDLFEKLLFLLFFFTNLDCFTVQAALQAFPFVVGLLKLWVPWVKFKLVHHIETDLCGFIWFIRVLTFREFEYLESILVFSNGVIILSLKGLIRDFFLLVLDVIVWLFSFWSCFKIIDVLSMNCFFKFSYIWVNTWSSSLYSELISIFRSFVSNSKDDRDSNPKSSVWFLKVSAHNWMILLSMCVMRLLLQTELFRLTLKCHHDHL